MEREPKSDERLGFLSFHGLLRALRGEEDIAFRPLYDRGGPTSVYTGPIGPAATLARISDNVRNGRPAGEGLPTDPLNDPTLP
jgi:hypothetical protein